MVTERQFAGRRMEHSGLPTGRSTARGSAVAARAIGLVMVILFVGDAALADFLVQPMLLRRAVQPGRRITVELMLQNMDPQNAETITLGLAELSQNRDASWIELQPDDPNLSEFPVRSCRSWIAIPPEPLLVPPYRQVPFTVQIDVPGGVSGFYFAAIVASTAPTTITDETGTVSTTQFAMVVPVVLEVQNLVLPRKISVTGAGLEYRPATVENPAFTLASVDIANDGGTFSSIMPVIRLWGQSGGHWRKVLDAPVGETGILPGAKLHLLHDLGRPLAPGTYRMEAFLYVDGRRGDVLEKQLKFEGDPTIAGNVHADVPLDIEPVDTFLEIVPGATRSGAIRVANGSEEMVTVQAQLALPVDMQSASNSRGVRGDDLSCADWVTVEPREFTMNGYSRTNLRVLARMPRGAAQYPCYYGTLTLRVFYRDGQFAGTKQTNICVQNKQVPGTPLLAATVLTASETGPSRYLVVGGYMNAGEMYLTPSCQGDLSALGVGGVATFKRFLMSSESLGQKGILLPFQARSFSGVLDLSDVPEGAYFLTSIVRFPGGPAGGVQKQVGLQVTEQGGRKYARMMEAQQVVPLKLQ
jgi:hypothetical protein